MTIEDRIRNHMHATPEPALGDGDLMVITKTASRRRRNNQFGAAVAGGVLAVGLVVGAAQLVDNDATQVDIAAPDDTATTTTAVDDPQADESESASIYLTASAFDGPMDSIVGVDDGFAGLRWSESGVLAIRSTDGLEWSESPTTGFPDGNPGFSTGLAHQDGTFVALFQSNVVSESRFGAPESGPLWLGTSTDLRAWTIEELEIELTDGVSTFPSGVQISNGRVVVLVTSYPEYDDPMLALLEAGVLTGEQLETSCGFDAGGPGEPIVVFSCDFSDDLFVEGESSTSAATTIVVGSDDTEVPADSTEEYGQEVLIELNPGDPGYDEVFEIINNEEEPEFAPTIFSVSGPVGGPYESTEISDSYQGSERLVRADGGFVTLAYGELGPVTLSSPDGVVWTPGNTNDFDSNGIIGLDDAVATAQGVGDRIQIRRSTDGGSTWTDLFVDIDSPIHQSWYSESRSGAAGTAVLVNGSADESSGEVEFLPEEPVVVVVDGYTASFDFGGAITLTDPAGAAVSTIDDWMNDFDAGGDIGQGLARFEGDSDEFLVFLDPDTGEDLITVTEQDFTVAMGEFGPDVGIDYTEPDVTSALLVTTDGESWRQISLPDGLNGVTNSASLIAVGDDEILLAVWNFDEPPFGETSSSSEPAPEPQEPQMEYIRIPLG